ncbi:pentapeptide repeat protein [Rivularia sp. IAM M-261]|nr:pentapeptide repeat protein [Rivularia sp. IAM M-261]
MPNPEHVTEIHKGVKSWNQWRRQNPCITPDLTKADLSLLDLSFADLRCAKLCSAKLSGIKLASANLSKADLNRTNLSKTILKFADFTNANLSQANLSRTDLRSTNFTNCNLSEANLSRADLSEAYLRKAYLYKANLSKSVLNKAVLFNADLSYANLSQADLDLAVLKDTYLQNADLTGVQVRGSNFLGACLTGACIDWNINRKTNLTNVICDYVYLKNIYGAGFTNRYPANGTFQPGEFTRRFEQISETIEIVFANGGIKEFDQSFQKLQQEYPEQVLEVEVIEPKNDTEFVARMRTFPKAEQEDTQIFYEEQLLLAKATYELQARNQTIELYKQHSADIMELAKLALGKEKLPINLTIEATAMSNSDGFTNNLQGANIANFANQVSDNARQQANQHNYSSETKSLADAAKEIQMLLEQLSVDYPSDTMKGKYTLANEVIRHIDNNPSLSQRIVSAFSAGSVSALGQFLNHPAASFVISALEDWKKTRAV